MLAKSVKIVLGLVIVGALGFGGLLFWKAKKSQSIKPEVGLVNGLLQTGDNKPNWVSSMAEPGTKNHIAPIESSNIEGIWDNLNVMIKDLGLEVVTLENNYIHATATTSLMGFVDDVEFHLNIDQGLIGFRSRSRVGYSDMGANRKRIEKIKKLIQTR